jgi:HxlR-like helix-turn-helix protein
VLSERLRQLEHGLVSGRRLGCPAPALFYQLTARAWALDPVLTGLAQWGAVSWLPPNGWWLGMGCVKAPASLFGPQCEGDRRSAGRLLEHLVLALQRAAAMETPTT